MPDEVLFEVVDTHTALVTINRPERGNSVDGIARDMLNDAWEQIRTCRDIRSAVVTGAGDKHFCTGLDLRWNLERVGDPRSNPRWPDLVDLWKPVILAVNGVCCGGGNHLLYQSDFAIGSENASFLEPHVSVGFVPVREALGLATRMPFGAAARMSLVGREERVDAEDALRLGLITEVVPADSLIDRAVTVCERINRQSPAAVRATKELLHKARGLMYAEYGTVQWAEALRTRVHQGPDYLEGQRAFLEGRPPRWDDDA